MSQLTVPFPGQKPKTSSQDWVPAFSEPAMQARSPKPKSQMNAYMGDKGNSGVSSFQLWKSESEFIFNNNFSSFHLPVTILLGKNGVLFLLVCAKSHFWQLWTKADEDTAPLEASLLIRSGKSLHSYQGIFLINTVQWMLVLPAAVLIPSCDLKYLMAANHYSSFYPRIFCHFQHLSFSGINFIFLPCKKWTDELQTSWQAPHKHILVLTHWGVSKMWSQVTHFLSPRAKPQGSTYFKRQKHVENLDRPMFLQWKYRFYDFLLNTFRLVGRGG